MKWSALTAHDLNLAAEYGTKRSERSAVHIQTAIARTESALRNRLNDRTAAIATVRPPRRSVQMGPPPGTEYRRRALAGVAR